MKRLLGRGSLAIVMILALGVYLALALSGQLLARPKVPPTPTAVPSPDSAAAQGWLQQLGSPESDSATCAGTSEFGAVYIGGETAGALDGASAGESDAFLARYDAGGNRVWTRQLGSSGRDAAKGLGVDDAGSAYMAGLTFGALNGANAGSYDAFLAKYDRDGKLLWIAQLGSSLGDYASSAAADSAGDAYIAGDTFGSLGAANAGMADAYLAKFGPDGQRLWVQQLGSGLGEVAKAVSVDAKGNVYIAGQTDGGLDGANAGASDAFVAKYDPDGNRLWVRQLGTSALDYANGISAGPDGSVTIAGQTDGSLDGMNAGQTDAFVARYDTDGNRLWVRQLGTGALDVGNGVSHDGQGAVYLGGGTDGSLDGTNAGQTDVFVAKYDAAGNRLWIKQFGTSQKEAATALTANAAGSVFLAGVTNGDLGAPSAGGFDAFLARVQ